ncbi:MAG TPA: hydroxyphenylacetyl-CoA thioesterase PaaI [Nocardioidaceae bacterium]|nr:hydroxyphenylacetyl-CoA thioesterase PaaI [Nocardioidaceae bacterium]
MTTLTPDELARRCADAMWAEDVASQSLGMTLIDVGPGRATLSMPVRADMANGHGIAHGGFVFALADSAFAFACNTYNERTVAYACDIVFAAPSRVGDLLTASAVERHRFGRNGVYDIRVVREADGDEDAEVVAEFRGRSRTIGGAFVDAE